MFEKATFSKLNLIARLIYVWMISQEYTQISQDEAVIIKCKVFKGIDVRNADIVKAIKEINTVIESCKMPTNQDNDLGERGHYVQKSEKSTENNQNNEEIDLLNLDTYTRNTSLIQICKEKEEKIIKKESSSKLLPKKESKKEESKPVLPDNIHGFTQLINAYTTNECLRQELLAHLKTRRAKKATLTIRAIELSFMTLDKLATCDEEKVLIVRQSIENAWTAFYALKPEKKEEVEKSKSSPLDYSKMGVIL